MDDVRAESLIDFDFLSGLKIYVNSVFEYRNISTHLVR